MTRKSTEWPFENGQTEKVGPSDGRRGDAVVLAAESKYDFRELVTYLGNVGSRLHSLNGYDEPEILPVQLPKSVSQALTPDMLGRLPLVVVRSSVR